MPVQTRLVFQIVFGLTVLSTAVLFSGCDDGATPADFVGTWRFVNGNASVVIGTGTESDVDIDDPTGETFDIALGTGGADLHLILDEFDDCTFVLETVGNFATAAAGANPTCHSVDTPAEYDVDLQGVVFGVNVSAGTGAMALALSGTLFFDGDTADLRSNVIGSVEKVP